MFYCFYIRVKFKKFKDLKKREKFKSSEKAYKLLKGLIKMNKGSSSELFFREKLNDLNKDYKLSQIYNYCVVTGRSRSIVSKYRISRITFRKFCMSGKLPGVVKSSF